MIRFVSVEDAQAIQQIVVSSLRYEYCTVDVVRRRIAELSGDDRCVSLVWADDKTGEVQGFIHGLPPAVAAGSWYWGKRRHDADYVTLAVAPESQGQGIGRALLERLEDEVRERGGRFVRLNSNVTRTEAHQFYEHIGYTCDKVQKHFVREL